MHYTCIWICLVCLLCYFGSFWLAQSFLWFSLLAEAPFRPIRQLSEYKGKGASASREFFGFDLIGNWKPSNSAGFVSWCREHGLEIVPGMFQFRTKQNDRSWENCNWPFLHWDVTRIESKYINKTNESKNPSSAMSYLPVNYPWSLLQWT